MIGAETVLKTLLSPIWFNISLEQLTNVLTSFIKIYSHFHIHKILVPANAGQDGLTLNYFSSPLATEKERSNNSQSVDSASHIT